MEMTVGILDLEDLIRKPMYKYDIDHYSCLKNCIVDNDHEGYLFRRRLYDGTEGEIVGFYCVNTKENKLTTIGIVQNDPNFTFDYILVELYIDIIEKYNIKHEIRDYKDKKIIKLFMDVENEDESTELFEIERW